MQTLGKLTGSFDFRISFCTNQLPGRHLGMAMTPYLGRRWSDLDKIWYADRESNADDDGNVKVEHEVEF